MKTICHLQSRTVNEHISAKRCSTGKGLSVKIQNKAPSMVHFEESNVDKTKPKVVVLLLVVLCARQGLRIAGLVC